jgi:DNA-binding YbaB/EbfC family protein
MDLNDIMRLAGQVKEQVQNAQSRAAEMRVAGEAGGGLVRVVMNGKHEVLEVKIDPKCLVPSEVALLEDLVRAACNQAATNVSDALKDKIADLGRQFGIDPSMLGAGGFPGFGGGGGAGSGGSGT